ncbi:MAG TPA: hypothetical protein VFX02_04355 [Gammaproteobacteria bacterium]|nr:hypothetical protein [Gammaproteobacteria bacterium]
MQNRLIRALGLVAVISLSGGCVPKPDFIEEGFVPYSAFAEGIVVGGVALVEDPRAEYKYAQLLEKLLKKQEQYKVAEAALVEKSVGVEEYQKLLEHYRNNRSVDNESLANLARLLDGYGTWFLCISEGPKRESRKPSSIMKFTGVRSGRGGYSWWFTISLMEILWFRTVQILRFMQTPLMMIFRLWILRWI